jgi:L-threonylcarbamoyladenylate synthase
VELRLPSDPAPAAETLYRRMHDLDQEGYDWIAIDMPPDTPEWAGIRDRIIRAAHPGSS